MNDLIKTKFFVLMNEDSQEITNEQMQRAYGKFIAHIDTVSQVGDDLAAIIRKLNSTRAELVFLSTQIQHEQGGNALKFAYLQKVLSFLDSEIDLLKLTFLQANRHSSNIQSDNPNIYIYSLGSRIILINPCMPNDVFLNYFNNSYPV